MVALYTLLKKESARFLKVFIQTIFAPMFSSVLYLIIFSQVMQNRFIEQYNVPYIMFLIPGLIMMQILQNAFSNPSSSLIQSKITGSLIFLLLSPISTLEFFFGYLLAGVIRGILVGITFLIVSLFFVDFNTLTNLANNFSIYWLILFMVFGATLFSVLGILAGLCSEKYDHITIFNSFIIMPLIMLSGVFYTIEMLPGFWENLLYFNPIFYIIDGFRYSFFGISKISPFISLFSVLIIITILSLLTIYLIKTGWKLRQ